MRVSSKSITLTGIVTHLGKTGDSHRLVEVMSLEEGRLTLFARGARASKKRFGGSLEVFHYLALESRQVAGSGLWPLQAAEVLWAPKGTLKTSFRAMARGFGLLGVIRSLFPERQASPEAFTVLKRALGYLDEGQETRAAAAYIHLARLAGILPDSTRCGLCKKESRALKVSRTVEALVCHSCQPQGGVLPRAVLVALATGRTPEKTSADIVENLIADLTTRQGGRPVHLLAVPREM